MTTEKKNDDDEEKRLMDEADDELPVDPAVVQAAAEAYERLEERMRTGAGAITPQDEKDFEALSRFEEALPPEEISDKEKEIERATEELVARELRASVDELRTLLRQLPEEFSSFEHFSALEPVSTDEQAFWEDSEDVRFMGEDAKILTRVGFRPVNLMEVLHFTQLLADRQTRDADFQSPHVRPDGSIHLNADLLQREIRMVFEARMPLVEVAYAWFLDVLRHKPDLLEGYQGEVVADGVILRPNPKNLHYFVNGE